MQPVKKTIIHAYLIIDFDIDDFIMYFDVETFGQYHRLISEELRNGR